MALRKFRPDELEAAADAWRSTRSEDEAAASLGIGRGAFRALMASIGKKTAESGVLGDVPLGHSVDGVSTLVDADGRPKQQWIKTKNRPSPDDILERLGSAFEHIKGIAKPVRPPKHADKDLATVYLLPDLHVGMLAWGRETKEPFDLKIAETLVRDVSSRLADATPKSEQAVILGLGDFLHIDGYKHETPTNKNPLDADSRYPKILDVGVWLLIFQIDLALTKHRKVLVRILPGNHDPLSALIISKTLRFYYLKEPRVVVDDDPGYYWWWQWGSTLLGATHGDAAKMKELPLIMAADNPKAWGETKFRSVYTGHIHQQTGLELGGVTVESFQSPSARDAWHAKMGYRAQRSLQAITHHKTLGEISRARVMIPPKGD